MNHCTRRPWPALILCATLLATATAGAAAVKNLQTPDVQRLVQGRPADVLVLDVRTPREFAGGRMPGSVLIPMQQIPARLGEISPEKKVVVVCATGARSAAVARFLDQRGFPWVANYTNGLVDWARRGLPVER